MASSSLRSRVTALAKSWPVDPLRPNVHFGSSIEKQLGTVNYEALSPESLKYAERAVQNLEGIRSGKESSLHPMAKSILAPKSDPEYYSRIRSAVEAAARGERMTWTWAQRLRVFFGGKP